jgi:RND superfamily putative drug exporter
MATLLYRLGRFAYRRAWTVLAVWLVLFVAILGGGFALGGQTSESFDIPGTESQDALDRLAAVFPQVAGASAQAIVEAPPGSSVTDEEYRPTIDKLVAEIRAVDGIDSVVGPFDEFATEAVSDDERLARIQVQFDGASTEVTELSLEQLTATAEIGREADLRVEFGGQVFQDNTFGITISEVFGVIFAGLVLFITFGSLAAAGMPLLSALVGVGIVVGGITAISAFTSVSSTAPLLALMIGLAVGIDYSLFILSRHRNQLAAGEDPEESAAIAVGTAGNAVVFAGITVIIALLGLLVVGIPFLSVMGIGAAFAVLVAILVAITLLPAILGLAKGRLAPKPGSRAYLRARWGLGDPDDRASDRAAPASTEPATPERERPTMGARWVRVVMRSPILVTLGCVAILGTLAVPALSLDLNLPDNGSEPAGSTQRQAYDLVSDAFGPGYNGPLVVAVDITQTTTIFEDLDSIGDELRTLDGVSFVSQGIPDAGLDTAIIQVIPKTAPDSPETKALVQTIRDLAPGLEAEYDTAVSVTGATAVGIDISNRLTSALVPFGLVVVGLSIILLMMVFRSVLVPLKAAVGFLLSVVASFGVIVAIFQWGWFGAVLGVDNPGPIISFLPILLMAVLFGLAMDYEVFLVSGMREEFVRTGNARTAVTRGFSNGARVVTAAALIMFFVFFAFVPEGSGAIKAIALGLAIGIVLDAFLVRMTLVPAVMTLLGRAAWWLPAWLGRLLPDMDIEGEKLGKHREAARWAEAQGDAIISMERLVASSGGNRVGPLTVNVPAGALALVIGERRDREILVEVLSGRREQSGGRVQLDGHPLPSESSRVRRLAAIGLVDTGESAGRSFGEILGERIAVTRQRFPRRSIESQAEELIQRIGFATADSGARTLLPIDLATGSSRLPHLERAVASAAAAIAERAPVVLLEPGDFASTDDARDFLRIVSRLAPASTTLVVGVPTERLPELEHGLRPIVRIPLSQGGAPEHPLSGAFALSTTSIRKGAE